MNLFIIIKMRVKSSLKPICKDCYFVRRKGTLYMRCKTWPRHKRRQGFSSMVTQPGMTALPETAQLYPNSLTSFWMQSKTYGMFFNPKME